MLRRFGGEFRPIERRPPAIPADMKQRLLDKIVKRPGPMADECWVWTGQTNGPHPGCGYGQVVYGGQKHQALHRVSYRVFVDDIPEELQVNHLCHVRLCINPSHLYVGTHQDNMDDMWEAGRNALFGEDSVVLLS